VICFFGCKDSYQGTPFRRAEPYEDKDPALAAAMSIPTRHADPARVIAGARTFFVTSSISGKRNLLQSDRSANLFIRVLYDYRAQRKFRLHEFVVMPDHFHALLTVEDGLTIERAVQFMKGVLRFWQGGNLGFVRRSGKKGFRRCVFSKPTHAFPRTAEYIRNNPVARHLAVEATRYPHSSAYPGFALDPAPQGLKPVFPLALERYG
jgi:putative transposase